MLVDWAVIGVFGLPALVVALGLGYAALRRYFIHKERMAMIERGLVPPERSLSLPPQTPAARRSAGVFLTVVGLAITLGLLTLGIGPWLLAGLVPAAIGIGSLIEQELRHRDNGGDEDEPRE